MFGLLLKLVCGPKEIYLSEKHKFTSLHALKKKLRKFHKPIVFCFSKCVVDDSCTIVNNFCDNISLNELIDHNDYKLYFWGPMHAGADPGFSCGRNQGRSYGGPGGARAPHPPHKFSVPPQVPPHKKKLIHTYFLICQYRACVNTLLPTKIMLMHS